MADVTIQIPSGADTTRVLNAFAAVFNWTPTVLVNDLPVANPETKAAFAKRQVAIWVKGIVVNYEAEQAATTAKVAAAALVIT